MPAYLSAYTVEPGLLMLGPGRNSSGFLKLVNREARPAAIEIVVNEFSRDLDGRGILGKEAEGQFIVYPSQLILMPGDEVRVQVRWIGTLHDGTEQAFALTTREVAIPRKELPQQGGEGARISINVLLNYDVRVYVTPPGARPKMSVEAVAARAQSGRDLLEITLANLGTAHQSLREWSLLLTALDAAGTPLRLPPVKLPAQEVPGMSTALPANGRRRLLIPWPATLPVGRVRVALSP
jgi:fimbrial chaperone protein